MTLDELNAQAKEGEVVDEEEFDIEAESDEGDATLEENLTEACQTIDRLLSMMEEIIVVPKGRVVKRLPRHFQDVMEEANEFLEEVDYTRECDSDEEEAA